MVGPVVSVSFMLLAGVCITSLGPFAGLTVWLIVLGVFQSVLKALRRHVWR